MREKIRRVHYECGIAMKGLKLEEISQFIDISRYFSLLNVPEPKDINDVAHYLLEDKIIVRQDNGLFAITNLGGILLARKLADFENLSRKSIRIVKYSKNDRLQLERDDVAPEGYALSFENSIKLIANIIPSAQVIIGARRRKIMAFPILAIRELLANALIHQDFSISGTGPVVEIFANRLEITNPGSLLVDKDRIIDNPPRSRNEKLAALMRRFGLCEELGTGWDKIVSSCEEAKIPAPRIELYSEATKVILFSEIPFANIIMEDKLRACYFHACIKHMKGEQLTNRSLRERFGLDSKASGSISRLIKEAIAKNLIKPLDPDTAPRHMKYVPVWA